MELRPLGRTGVKVSSLCLGCMMFGGKTNPDDSYAIIDKAIDQGINFIDTANVYSIGRSEGDGRGAAPQRPPQPRRPGHEGPRRDGQRDPNMQGNSRRHIIQQCEASLRRLKTDWIDLYQIHRPQSDIPIDETLRALDDLIRAGKVRYIGSSTFGAWQLVESLYVAKELGTHRFVCEQPPYNLLDRRIERELLPMARTYGLAVIPWSPLAGGLLTGKYQRGQELPEGARFADVNNPIYRARLNDRIYDVIEGLQPIADAKGCTLSQLALAWVLHQPGVTSPIIGPRTMEQYDDNMKALDVEITEDDPQADQPRHPPRRQRRAILRIGLRAASVSVARYGLP